MNILIKFDASDSAREKTMESGLLFGNCILCNSFNVIFFSIKLWIPHRPYPIHTWWKKRWITTNKKLVHICFALMVLVFLFEKRDAKRKIARKKLFKLLKNIQWDKLNRKNSSFNYIDGIRLTFFQFLCLAFDSWNCCCLVFWWCWFRLCYSLNAIHCFYGLLNSLQLCEMNQFPVLSMWLSGGLFCRRFIPFPCFHCFIEFSCSKCCGKNWFKHHYVLLPATIYILWMEENKNKSNFCT